MRLSSDPIRQVPALLLLLLCLPVSAAQAVTVDFKSLGSYFGSAVEQSGSRTAAEVGVALLNVVALNGIGVKGGPSDNTLDPDESIRVTFSSPASAVSYNVDLAQNADGDGSVGEAWVEGFASDGSLLGVGTLSGVGDKNVSALFGNVPLSGFRILTRDGDRQRLGSLSFTIGANPQTIVGFKSLGTYYASAIEQPEVRVAAESGVALLNVVALNGFGVKGGTSDNSLDPDESVWVRFPTPAKGVSFTVHTAFNGDGDGLLGETWVEGYGTDGSWIGVGSTSGLGAKDVSALFGNAQLSAFRILTRDGDRLRISGLSFTPEAQSQVAVDFQALGTFYSTGVNQPWVQLTAERAVAQLDVLALNGIGVRGGASDNTIDPDESVRFGFQTPATSVSYDVSIGFNGDADGFLAETWIEGYAIDGSLLGVGTVSGIGPMDVSALFGNVPLSGFRVLTRDGDRHRIGALSFTPGANPPVTHDLQNAGSFYTSRLELAGVHIVAERGVPLLDVVSLNGLGVRGGPSDSTIDPDESLRIMFDGPASGVIYRVEFATNGDADAETGEAWVEGYAPDGSLMGVLPVSGVGDKNVSALFSNKPLSGFRVLTRDGDRQRISQLDFNSLLGVEDGPRPRTPVLRIAGANPIRSQGTLAYELPRAGQIQITLHDLQGRCLATLTTGQHPSGTFRTALQTHGLQPGLYFALLSVDGAPQSRTQVVILR